MSSWHNYISLFLLVLLCSSCKSDKGYSYKSHFNKEVHNPVANVEKAWMARNNYDHERRLLVPMVGGTRWGAIQEYKEDGTLLYRDWWVRDVKIEDLKPAPSTLLRKITSSEPKPKSLSLDQIIIEKDPEQENFDIPDINEPILNDPQIETSIEAAPVAPLPFETLPPALEERDEIIDDPFAPLPQELPPL